MADALPVTGYSLRNASIPKAMLGPDEDFGIEAHTSMAFAGATTGKAPVWARFSISSVSQDSDIWTEHCTGEIKVEVNNLFTQVGLRYGPGFQRLSDILIDPMKNLAVGKINMSPDFEKHDNMTARYPLHPTAFDASSQLAINACYGGQHERAQRGLGELRGLRSGHAKVEVRNRFGDIAFSVNKLRFPTISEESRSSIPENSNLTPILRLAWKLDVRLITMEQASRRFPAPEDHAEKTKLLETIERFAVLVLMKIAYRYLGNSKPDSASEDIHLFTAWAKRRLSDENE
ncbi:polyketide synthase dehydratase-domain-containing protein [Xylaria cubensis]|nr:polyketide synthase dehydratase-domain-containing protein [Xylaria cubensis]